jgi:Cu+-exporting ATPase
MTNNICIHCGANCGKNPIEWENNLFCCNGCKQVYQLLNENKLTQYYTLQDAPGIRIEDLGHDGKYAYLDKDEVKEKIYEFYENNIAKVVFYIPSIHCVSCIWLLENLHRLNRGVKHAAVNFINKQYTVSFNTSEISLRQLVELLVSIHYIPDISLKTLDKKDIKSINRTLWYKIGVAGFIFGNVMLYSLPDYFNGEPIGGSLGLFLYYLSFILAIPLVFYSGSDYIISSYKNLIKGIINIDLPIAIGILTLFFVTGYQVFTHSGPGYSDTLSGFLFFLLLGRAYQSKTYQSLSFDRDYKSYFPVAVTKITDGKEESTLLKDIQVDDKLLIRSKELIPADSVLEEGTALIDYSFVSGESTPVVKKAGEFVYAGGIQTSGNITIKVDKEVTQSHLTQLWNQSDDKNSNTKSLTSIIDKLSVYFTVSIILIALIAFFIWLQLGDFGTAILVLTSVLIVACPCALAMSMPFTFGSTMRIFGSKGLYIKNTAVIEKLTKINTLVFDKTGTLTKPDENNINFVGIALSDKEIQYVHSIAKQSTHPLSQAIAKNYTNLSPLEVSGFIEVLGRGIFGMVEGRRIKLGSQEYVSNSSGNEQLKGSQVYLAINDEVKGYFTINNKYREGFESLIHKLSHYFRLYLLSGDNESERSTLARYFRDDRIYFNQKPQDKMDFIKSLQSQGRNVLMTGDGLNDAGAFMQSDVALSIADDIYHFSPAGDAIIDAAKFRELYKFIKFARQSMVIVKLSFAISLLYNIIGLSIAVTGNLSPVVAAILMPVSSISVVAFATFATRLVAKRSL